MSAIKTIIENDFAAIEKMLVEMEHTNYPSANSRLFWDINYNIKSIRQKQSEIDLFLEDIERLMGDFRQLYLTARNSI